MNLRNQQQEMQKCSTRGSEFTKQIESLPKEYQEQLQPFVTSAVKSTATVQQKLPVAGGTNKLNEEVKQLKGEIHQTTNGLQKTYQIQQG